MHYALAMFPTDYAIHPAELGKAAEDRGFESLWFPEHTHIPASRKTPWPAGGELPKEYWHTHDPFVALGMAAAVTTKLKLATGICLVIERDPIVTAKEVATLDFLSGGRAIFGIGAGWNVEEMNNHGTEFRTRWKLMRERVEAMKAIWRDDEASYDGEFVKFERIWSWPKPKQTPHPPVYLGGHGPKSLERVVRYCDGWMPIAPFAGDASHAVGLLHQTAEKAGRDPKTLSVTFFMAPPDEELLDGYAKAGVERAVLNLPSAPREQILPMLDRYAKLIR